MEFNFLLELFQENKDEKDLIYILCCDGSLIRGTVLKNQLVKGEKYYDRKVVEEGTFLDGELSGSGKMYSQKGILIYEGDFENHPLDFGSMYHGQGREYHAHTGELLYEGQFEYNQRSGRGKEYYPSGQLRYEGGFESCVWCGDGACYNEDGFLICTGIFVNGCCIDIRDQAVNNV